MTSSAHFRNYHYFGLPSKQTRNLFASCVIMSTWANSSVSCFYHYFGLLSFALCDADEWASQSEYCKRKMLQVHEGQSISGSTKLAPEVL